MRCFGRAGCLVLVVVVACVAWFTRDSWLKMIPGAPVAIAVTPAEKVWQPLDSVSGERAADAIDRLTDARGPVFAKLTAAEVGSYVVRAVGKSFPKSADSVEAAVIGDRLYVRAVVPTKDIASSGAVGPLASLLNDRERITLGGTFHVIKPGLSEFTIREIKLRDFKLPSGAIPRLMVQIKKGTKVEGVADDAFPVPTPKSLGDVRIADGRVTLYRSSAGITP